MKDYVSSNFNPKRTHIYVAGRFDVPAVKKAIAERLGGWNATGAERAENVPTPNPQRVLDVTDRVWRASVHHHHRVAGGSGQQP